jgi:hypothetical protein
VLASRRSTRGRAASERLNGDASPGFERTALRLPPDEVLQFLQDTVGAKGELWIPVSGNSMLPTIRPGDRVLLTPTRRRLARGDVVIVALGTKVILHRVVSLVNQVVVTRGDSCQVGDPPIEADRVFARAVAVRHDRVLTTLTPTLRFGVAALCRFFISEARRRGGRLHRRLQRHWESRP